jgi:hypothetical protein
MADNFDGTERSFLFATLSRRFGDGIAAGIQIQIFARRRGF